MRSWLEANGVSGGWIRYFVEAFPEESRKPVDDPLVNEWAGAVDDFRFTLEDWVAALVRLEHSLKRAGRRGVDLQRQLGYVHCAAMVGDIEEGTSLPDIVDDLYRKHGFADEAWFCRRSGQGFPEQP